MDDEVAFPYGHINDGTAAPPVSPTMAHKQAEPYMQSGYEQLARRDYEQQVRSNAQRNAIAMEGGPVPLQESTRYNQATDPAYHRAPFSKGQQDMENQYGRAMGFVPFSGEDDEMVL